VEITVSDECESVKTTLNLVVKEETYVQINPNRATIWINQTLPLDVTVNDENGNPLGSCPGPVFWFPPEDIITFDIVTATVRGVSEGTATITATCEGKSGSATIEVKQDYTLIVSPQILNLYTGEYWLLTAKLYDHDGNESSCSSLNWYSSNLDVIEIAGTYIPEGECLISAIGEGTASVSANCDGFLGSASVVVNNPPPVLTVAVEASNRTACNSAWQEWDLIGDPPSPFFNTCTMCYSSCFTVSQQAAVSGGIDSGTAQIHITGSAQTDAYCFDTGSASGNILDILVYVWVSPSTPLTYTITGSVTPSYDSTFHAGWGFGFLESCGAPPVLWYSAAYYPQNIYLSGTWPCAPADCGTATCYHRLEFSVNAIAGCAEDYVLSDWVGMDFLITVQVAAP